MLRTLLRFGRISYNPGDLQIGTPEFIVPENITQRLYQQFYDTPVTGIRIVSDFDGKLCEFIDPKLVEISKSRYEGIQIAYNETLMLKTRVRYGVISLVDDDVKFVNGNFQIPRLIADTLMENHHATPCGELYVISDEKRNLRFTVKVGKVHQMRSFVNKKRLNII